MTDKEQFERIILKCIASVLFAKTEEVFQQYVTEDELQLAYKLAEAHYNVEGFREVCGCSVYTISNLMMIERNHEIFFKANVLLE